MISFLFSFSVNLPTAASLASILMLLILVLSLTLVVIDAASSSSASSSPFSLSLPTTFQLSSQHHHHHHHKSLLLQSSSTVQKQYTKPPHDIKLYDTLRVKSNATLAEIQKSWRRLSRDWHPDKVAVRRRRRRNTNSNNNKRRLQQQRRSDDLNTNASNQNNNNNTQQVNEDDEGEDEQLKLLLEMQEAQDDEDEEECAKQKLAELTTAYEILSDDHTRLLYHKYGLIGGTDAAIQLLSGRPSPTTSTSASSLVNNEGIGSINDLQSESTGEGATSSTSTFDEQHQSRLLELMGYPPQGYATATSSSSWSHHNNHRHQYNKNEASRRHSNDAHHRQHQQRLAYLTATITERLRPIVEGTISQDLFVNEFYQEVNALKKSPLGAHILRCIGRAYRIEGYRVLRELQHHHQQHNNNNNNNNNKIIIIMQG